MRVVDPVLSAVTRLGLHGLSMASHGPRLSILIFHRVLPVPDALFPGEVDAARFDRLMALVARTWCVLPLADAVGRLAEGRLPHRALSITFDDGYADNHEVALPILQRHGLSACFFIATGFLNGGRMFNDTVIECVRRSSLGSVDLGDFGLARLPLATPAERAQAVGALLPKIKYLTPERRPEALERLQRVCEVMQLPDDLMMVDEQVRALHAAGMEIGAHTVRHPILATLSDSDAEHEMVRSRDALQALVGAPVTLFAYPNGRPDQDYGHRHAAMARRLGFAAAVSTAPGVSGPTSDPFQLPRFTPWDSSAWRWMGRLGANLRRREFSVARAP